MKALGWLIVGVGAGYVAAKTLPGPTSEAVRAIDESGLGRLIESTALASLPEGPERARCQWLLDAGRGSPMSEVPLLASAGHGADDGNG